MRTPPLPVPALTQAADAAIVTELNACAGPPSFSEPATVAHIVTHATGAIALAWKPLLATHGCVLTLTGVYCHQHPQVSFAHPHAPVELADLLVVMDYDDGTTIVRRAALVQAKMARSGLVTIGAGKPGAQLHLFQNWPPFDFRTSGYARRPPGRDFGAALPHKANDCGRYGVIDLAASSPSWMQVDPSAGLPWPSANGVSLGAFLAGMADDQAGCGNVATHCAGAPSSGLDDWSFTIAELMHITYRLAHAAMTRAGSAGGNRGVSATVKLAPTFAKDFADMVAATGQARPSGAGSGLDGVLPPALLPPPPRGGRGISLVHGLIGRL
jgi:hypothetical protein